MPTPNSTRGLTTVLTYYCEGSAALKAEVSAGQNSSSQIFRCSA